jgi:putative CocE/NonD family hydrolase
MPQVVNTDRPPWSCRAARVFALLFLLLPLTFTVAQAQGDKVSRPGQYVGYSRPLYEEWVRASQYVAARDGTKLAIDIFRPASGGQPVSQPLPVVWSHNRYHRADISDGRLQTILDSTSWLKTLLRHGYVIAVADARGSGASFGTRAGPYSLQDAQDAYDMTEWLAAQPWCNGKVGMFGASFMGDAQLMAASLAPPHLKAIVPQAAPFDRYFEYYPGGVFMDQAAAEWSRVTREMDTVQPAAPVDEDRDGAMLAQAMAEHQANVDFYPLAASLPYRDSVATKLGQPWLTWGASNYMDAISRSGVAIYHIAGWRDGYQRGALLSFRNLSNLSPEGDLRQKILIGPWTHDRVGEYFDLAAEHLRWYDYWLKGIDNGVMAEPPIYYYTLGLPEKQAWRFAAQWPLPDEQPTPYYFRDGLLDTSPPADSAGQDHYTVDYSTTTREGTAWDDQKGLTYTSRPLPQNLQVTGHPVVHLWITSTASDGDWFVYLEEVAENGVSQYVTDGVLRTSHRALSEPPFDYIGLPFHRGFAQDVALLPRGEPVELVLDLLPISNIFDAGHRIRVTITGADQGNALTPVLSPPPQVSVHRNARHASHIVLPIIPIESDKTAQPPNSGVVLPVVAVVLATLAIAAALGVAFIKKTLR